ncbi:unnamed protein product, partial [Cercopithifilaria johnstoni]
QMDKLFGDNKGLLSLFTNTRNESPTQEPEATTVAATTLEPVEAPQTPRFCVAIY